MNVIFLSPHFPPSYYLFCVHLKRLGANVLGIGEEPYESLRSAVKDSLTEYYRVDRLDDDQTLRAVGYFIHRYGRIDRIASHNEHWLTLEGYLRDSFNVFGKKIAATEIVKRKSLMKRKFLQAGINVAPGKLVRTFDEALAFAREVGYPVVAKPDKGVGATGIHKLTDTASLDAFFRNKPDVDYFVEAYIDGSIETFDGLCDRDANVVFYMSLVYGRSIMDTIADDDHIYYYTRRELPEDLVDIGIASARAFELRESFFHFEFFRTRDGRLLALELNARPPGWPITDMFNYANDADAYREWANIVVRGTPEQEWPRKYHCMFIGRKARISYRHAHDEIVQRYGSFLVDTIDIPGVFARAMGDRAYIARSSRLDDLEAMAAFVQEKV